MTVRELLAVFGDCDPDAEVVTWDHEFGADCDINEICLTEKGRYAIGTVHIPEEDEGWTVVWNSKEAK